MDVLSQWKMEKCQIDLALRKKRTERRKYVDRTYTCWCYASTRNLFGNVLKKKKKKKKNNFQKMSTVSVTDNSLLYVMKDLCFLSFTNKKILFKARKVLHVRSKNCPILCLTISYNIQTQEYNALAI